MAADKDAEVALLYNNSASRSDSFQSDASTSDHAAALGGFLEATSDGSSNSSNQTISMPVDQFERLLRTCADALQKSRSSTQGSPPRPRCPDSTGSAQETIKEIKPLYPHAKILTQRDKSDGSQLRLVDHYESQDTETAIFDDEDDWNDAKSDRKSVLDSVEDVWESYFPSCHHSPNDTEHGKCHPFTDGDLRMGCQKDLVLARLNLEHDGANVKDAYRFLPWLSLMGYKLHQIHSLTRSFSYLFQRRYTTSDGVGAPQCNILVQLLRYFFEGPVHYLGRHEEFLIGTILAFCYKRGILPRPECPSDPVLERNFQHLINALWILNIIQTPQYWLTFTCSYNVVQQRLPLIGPSALDLQPLDVISCTVEEIELAFQQRKPDLPIASGENVRCSDLNIQALRNIGGLKIVWTACDRDHLFLDQENGVLRVSWFNRVMAPEFYRYMPILGRNDVSRTWDLLLGHRKHQYDFTDLEKIPLPPELCAYGALLSRPSPRTPLRRTLNMRSVISTRPFKVPDLYDKFLPLANLPLAVPYSYFGSYEERIRILRHYMDTRKPNGIRNLWHDRRDTLTYYTFWAVLVFGGLSVLLALLGLMVGAAQTYAAFKQLDSSLQTIG